MDQLSFFNDSLIWRIDNSCWVNKYYVIAETCNGFRAYFSHYDYEKSDWDHLEFGYFKTLKDAKDICQMDFDLNGEIYEKNTKYDSRYYF